jgi:hypothetical protein
MTVKSRHDRKIKEIIRRLKRQGWKVHADVMGFPRPERIGKIYRPDIVAENKKTGRKKIVEVKMGRDLKKSKRRLSEFSKFANKNKKIDFELVITNPKKLK